MINSEEASYIITELRNIPTYRKFIKEYSLQISELDTRIAELSEPHSPNGKEYIGEAKGNEVHTFETALTALSTQQAAIEWDRKFYAWSLKRAEGYLNQLMASDFAEYVNDYLNTKDKRKLQEKYHISNAYDRMKRIVKSVIHTK